MALASAAVAGVGVGVGAEEGGVGVCCCGCCWFSAEVEAARREPEIIKLVRAN